MCPKNPSYYGNRAATLMMLCRYREALEDAQQAVRLDGNFVKVSVDPLQLGERPKRKKLVQMSNGEPHAPYSTLFSCKQTNKFISFLFYFPRPNCHLTQKLNNLFAIFVAMYSWGCKLTG